MTAVFQRAADIALRNWRCISSRDSACTTAATASAYRKAAPVPVRGSAQASTTQKVAKA